MRIILFLLLLLARQAIAQENPQAVDITVRPELLHVENVGGNLVPMERIFFHVVIHNTAKQPVDIHWVRFDIVNSAGIVFSGQYSGEALITLFDSAIDRRRIEPTTKNTLKMGPDERKAISDVFLEFPSSFIGETLLVQVDYQVGAASGFSKVSVSLKRVEGFSGRLPFDGVWYVASEHGFMDPHKRFRAETFAYDFLQIGANGKSHQKEGARNSDYYAYGKKVLATKEGAVVFVRADIVENLPGDAVNLNTPGGNLVVIDHGNGQYGYYGHLRPNSIPVRVGSRVKAGEVIGEVGNSGDSTEPHLHFHVMNNPEVSEADGIPVVFENWKAVSYSRTPTPRQNAVLPKGEFVAP